MTLQRSKMRAAILAGTFTVMAATSVLTAPIASAGTNHAPCPAKTFCLYSGTNFSGKEYRFPAPGSVKGAGPYPQCYFSKLGYGLDNSTSSMINNTTRVVTLWANTGCGGDQYVAEPESFDSTFSNNHFVNRASGISFS